MADEYEIWIAEIVVMLADAQALLMCFGVRDATVEDHLGRASHYVAMLNKSRDRASLVQEEKERWSLR